MWRWSGEEEGGAYFGELWVWLAQGGDSVFVRIVGHFVMERRDRTEIRKQCEKRKGLVLLK